MRGPASLPLALTLLCAACASEPLARSVPLPHGELGLPITDVRFVQDEARVVAATGAALSLVDPATLEVTSIDIPEGASLVDGGAHLLFAASPRNAELLVLDPSLGVVALAPLASSAGVLRFVAASREVWVTEPASRSIEIFHIGASPPAPTAIAKLATSGSPVTLVTDPLRSRVLVLLGDGTVTAYGAVDHQLKASLGAGCAPVSDLAVDALGRAVVACSSGALRVLDARLVAPVGGVEIPNGVDALAISGDRVLALGLAPSRLTSLTLSVEGSLTASGAFDLPSAVSGLTVDGAGDAWSSAPERGELLVLQEIDLRP